MSPTKVIFTYKRKRFSSCSGVGHAEVCPEFSSDVQVDKHQDATKGRSESQEKDLKHVCHGKWSSSACMTPQVHKSSIFKEDNHVEESDIINTREMVLCSYELYNTFKTSSENISSRATLGNTRNSYEKDMDSCSTHVDGCILETSVSQSVEKDTDSPSKQLTAPLLTFSRRLKRKADASGTVVFTELPIREGSTDIKGSKSMCIPPCSCEVTSYKSRPLEESADLNAASNDPNLRNVLSQSRDEVTRKETGDSPCPCTRSYSEIVIMGRSKGQKSYEKDLNVDISPVTEHTAIGTVGSVASSFIDLIETGNISKENVQCWSNDGTVVSFCDGTSKSYDHHVSHQLRAFSGDSQLTSDGLDSKITAGKMAEQKAPAGAFVIDCNVIPESDPQEQASYFVQSSSIMVKTYENTMQEGNFKGKGFELFGDTDVQAENSLLQLPEGACASVEGETKPKIKYLQLFSEDGRSDLFPPASTGSESVCSKVEQNTTFALDSEKDRFERSSSKASAFLGLSLPSEPLLGQTSKHGSAMQPFEDHNVRTREFIQNPAVHSSFPDHGSLVFRHRILLESINTKATARRGNRNISLDKWDPCPTTWTEDELDSLWIGIRRHGRGNWHAMMLDTRLHFAPWRVARDLAVQWEQEQHKLLSMQHMPQGKHILKPPDLCNLDCNGSFMCPRNDTQLSLGDIYAQKEGSYSRSDAQSSGFNFKQPCKRVRKARKVGDYNCDLFNNLQNSVMIRSDAAPDSPAMGLATNTHFPHWLRSAEPSGTLCEPSNVINIRVSGFRAGGDPGADPSARKRGRTDNLIVIDSDASSEETISDDHNIRS